MSPPSNEATVRVLAVATAELGPALGAAVFKVAQALVDARLAGAVDGDPWIAHTEWTFCSTKRAACELARSGMIDGVRRLDRREKKGGAGGRGVTYVARRSAIEKYIATHAAPVVETTTVHAPARGPGALAKLGLKPVAGAAAALARARKGAS